MAKDCLWTKEKWSTNDDTLETLGVMVINLKTKADGTVRLSSASGTESIVRVLTEGVTITSATGTGAEVIDSKTAKISNGGWGSNGKVTFSQVSSYVKVEITNKYALTELVVSDIESTSKYVDYLTNLREWETEIWTPTPISKFSTFEKLSWFTVNATNLKGTLSDISNLVLLSKISLYNSGVNGSIEGFVVGQRANGRTTCDNIDCIFGNTGITFNGNAITGSSAKSLSWTASTITFDGVTINA